MNKKTILISFVSCILFISVFNFGFLFVDMVSAGVPGPPMVLYGSIKDTANQSISDGIVFKAYVVDPVSGNEWFNQSIANGFK